MGGLCTGEPMGRSVLHYKKSKNLSGEVYIQSSDTNSPGIIKTSQKIERLIKTRAFALNDCIYAVSIRTVTYEYLRAICTALSRDGTDY